MMTDGVGSRLLSRSDSTNHSKVPKDDDTTNASSSRDEERKEEYSCNMDGGTNDGVKVVAIVGAGFAGLVLANYLELQSKEREEEEQQQQQPPQTEEGIDPPKNPRRPPYSWTYKLFESKSSSGIPVIGTIHLESARDVLEELCLFEKACCCEQNGVAAQAVVFPKCTQNTSASTTMTATTTKKTTSMNTMKDDDDDDDDNYREVSRESFLELLRKNVKIQSSSRVVDIIEGSSSNDSLWNNCNNDSSNQNSFVVTEGDNDERAEHGPFDLVVAANGLSFRGQTTKTLRQKLKSASSSSSSSIVRIGDCRYNYGRAWWEFDFLGAIRRKSGADSAIRDGLLVGRRLLQRRPHRLRDPLFQDRHR
jgi:hypothetical protein